jgi:hypothetical protein
VTSGRPVRRGGRRGATLLASLSFVFLSLPLHAQLGVTETEDMKLIYFEPSQTYLVPHVGRSFTNALRYHQKMFGWTPWEKTTVFMSDFSDFGNAGANASPRNIVTLKLAPLSYAFETFTANERVNYLMNHELIHVVTMDQAAERDRFFRRAFRGKVAPTAEHPESMLYFFLTTPRIATPRWYLEGIAVFLDTWMAGGLGRAQGPYDEMVFRSMTKDGSRFYDPLGLASELTKVDFRLESNSYLYGGRFMNYLAYEHGPESLIRWTSRKDGSDASYSSQFENVYGKSINAAWQDWISFEKDFQRKNLETIHQYATTPFTDLSPQPLGSVSRGFVDAETSTLYLGLNAPGTLGSIGAVDLKSGAVTRIRDIKEPRVYTVTSLAFDPGEKTLFYTADNTAYRDLMALDPRTGRQRMLMKDARIGDIVFDRTTRSLWGIRVLNGICTLVNVPHPYTDWKQIHSWPYGEVVYDLDVSPDGTLLSAGVGQIDGKQSVRVMKTASMLSGDKTPLAEFDFGTAVPLNFVFSEDGKFLFGSSYYSGVSNIFRYEIATRSVEAMSNTDTGFFRPIPLGGDALLVFRYTGEGFVPARIEAKIVKDVAPVSFLGTEVVEKHPILKEWIADSPASVPIETLVKSKGSYSPFSSIRLESLYPIVMGYKSSVAYGVTFRFSDPALLNGGSITASYSPDPSLRSNERLHLRAEYQQYAWNARAVWNGADFYDLFGPTKVSRKGLELGLGWRRTLLYDVPRQLDVVADAAYYAGLDRLPEYQNVSTPFDRLAKLKLRLSYTNVQHSLGHVDDEKGHRWDVVVSDDYVHGKSYLKARADVDFGVPLPLKHSSVWLRSSAGFSPGDPDEPFAKFFFGGFGNNYVDHGEEQRYRDYYSLPGVELNEIGGRNYAKTLLEWCLPPLRFRRAGTRDLYASWIRPSVFASTLVTDLDSGARRRHVTDVGVQADLRFVVLSNLDMTLSVGHARAFEDGRPSRNETMISLKVLR